MKRTFVDAGVLITAARGVAELSAAATQVLSDPNRIFLSSLFVRLEVQPKPTYFKLTPELRFYESFFAAVREWASPHDALTQRALTIACTFGLSAIDALHVAAAELLGADELVTTERPCI